MIKKLAFTLVIAALVSFAVAAETTETVKAPAKDDVATTSVAQTSDTAKASAKDDGTTSSAAQNAAPKASAQQASK